MNAVVEMRQSSAPPARLSVNPAADALAHAKAVQEVMQSVMKPNVHYGVIPGTDKPTLMKSGAEVLCMTFRIGDKYLVTDISTSSAIRYRVECLGIHQESGIELGSGLGECSSNEEKYKWRKAVCDAEFDGTPETHRRIKYGRKQGGGHYTAKQVKNEPDDLANTVLKMACKRAKIAMVLNVTAASDMFSQDLEDLDAELARHLTEDDHVAHMEAMRSEWCAKAAAAKTVDELTTTMKTGVKVFQTAKDTEGYATFAKAVQERGAQLKKGAGHE